MKCVITGEETSSHNNGTPLSKKGRELLEKIIKRHNDKIKEFYIERIKKDNPDANLADEGIARFAPKVSRKQVLGLLKAGESDIMETRDEVLAEE